MRTTKPGKSERSPETVKAELEAVQAKIYHSRAERKELANRLIDARAFRSEDVEQVLAAYIGACKARLWSIPNSMPRLLVGHSTVEAITDALSEAIEEAAAELREYDPDALKSRSIDYATIEPEEAEPVEPDAEQ